MLTRLVLGILKTNPVRFLKRDIYLRLLFLIQSCTARKRFEHGEKCVIFYDISRSCCINSISGVPRVVQKVYNSLTNGSNGKYKIIPVIANVINKKYYPVVWDVRCCKFKIQSAEIFVKTGDVFLCLDTPWEEQIICSKTIKRYVSNGCRLLLTVHDLLPIEYPEFFNKTACEKEKLWLNEFATSATFLCISKATKEKLKKYNGVLRTKTIHLGVEFDKSKQNIRNSQSEIDNKSFLMVGTIEPRKNHLLVIEAFDNLIRQGLNLKLTIVGHKGWKCNDIIRKIKFFEKEKWLTWEKDCNDQQLCESYKTSKAVILASKDEGFGLPLIEAAFFNKYIIAKDISVFKEVVVEFNISKETVFWFNSKEELEEKIKKVYKEPSMVYDKCHWLGQEDSWSRCKEELINIIENGRSHL